MPYIRSRDPMKADARAMDLISVLGTPLSQ
jgi:hypothetical protein